MNSSGKVFILGVSGGIGGEVVCWLVVDNWQVWVLKCGVQMCDFEDGIQWIVGDVLDGGQVVVVVVGCDVIVYVVNLLGYWYWW